VNEMKSIIFRLYKYLEIPEHRNLHSCRLKLTRGGPDINPYDDFKCIYDNFDIRHFPSTMEKITGLRTIESKDTIELCDIAYYMFLEIVRIPVVIEYSNIVKTYKTKYLTK